MLAHSVKSSRERSVTAAVIVKADDGSGGRGCGHRKREGTQRENDPSFSPRIPMPMPVPGPVCESRCRCEEPQGSAQQRKKERERDQVHGPPVSYSERTFRSLSSHRRSATSCTSRDARQQRARAGTCFPIFAPCSLRSSLIHSLSSAPFSLCKRMGPLPQTPLFNGSSSLHQRRRQ